MLHCYMYNTNISNLHDYIVFMSYGQALFWHKILNLADKLFSYLPLLDISELCNHKLLHAAVMAKVQILLRV